MARKILLADDSVTAQNMGRKILTDAGYDVITVNNGSAALKRVAELKPDLIVLDVYMPGYSGLEVCSRLKDAPDTSRIPILLTVGKLEPFKPEEATRVRADGFIIKPFEASELLSALTRLEDRMVPAQSDGSRFSTSVSGIERFSGGDPMVKKSAGGDESDSGWKNRLRFPSKKKKEETEPEPEPDFVTPSSFREFRRGAGKAPTGSAPFPLSATPATAQEPGLVPDIPRDITPAELDALSDLVAKLDGPAGEPENVTSISEKIGPVESPAEAKNEVVAASAPAEAPKETEVSPAADAEPQIATPLERHPATEAVETIPAETTAPAVVAEEKSAAQESAPAEKIDEPTIASTANAAPSAVENPEVPARNDVGGESSAAVVEAKTETTTQSDEPKIVEAKVEEIPQPAPVAASSQETAGAGGGSSPSAEELAEALRFLTPSQTPGASQTLAEAGAALADELSRGPGAGDGNRWVAEAMALSPEEASGSLEDEMFRTFATSAGGQTAGNGALASGPDSEPGAAVTETAAGRAEAPAFTSAEESLAMAMAASAAASELVESARQDLAAKHAEEAPAEEATATFADAVRRDEIESVSATAQTATGASAQEPAHEEYSSSENVPGGQEAMGKDAKGKGKSTWHQIRSGTPTAANDAVEAAKQTEETTKTMAAAASADGASDPNSIASIVDSVLADLRPRIVEEIAKKLAKKN